MAWGAWLGLQLTTWWPPHLRGARSRLVAIAEALDVRRIATTDRRHVEPLATALALELAP